MSSPFRFLRDVRLYVTGRDQSYGVIPFTREKAQLSFLLVQHKAGHWAFPKGHPEWGEAPLTTAQRELHEEVGITAQELLPSPVFTEEYTFSLWGKPIRKQVMFFLARVEQSSVRLQLEEIKAAQWVTPEEARKLITFQAGRQVLESVLKYLKSQAK